MKRNNHTTFKNKIFAQQHLWADLRKARENLQLGLGPCVGDIIFYKVDWSTLEGFRARYSTAVLRGGPWLALSLRQRPRNLYKPAPPPLHFLHEPYRALPFTDQRSRSGVNCTIEAAEASRTYSHQRENQKTHFPVDCATTAPASPSQPSPSYMNCCARAAYNTLTRTSLPPKTLRSPRNMTEFTGGGGILPSPRRVAGGVVEAAGKDSAVKGCTQCGGDASGKIRVRYIRIYLIETAGLRSIVNIMCPLIATKHTLPGPKKCLQFHWNRNQDWIETSSV